MSSSHKKSSKPVVMQGTFCANARGFGFVAVPELEQDLFIPEGMTGTALDGDIVEATLLPGFERGAASGSKGTHRQEAEVTSILTRNTTSVVGTFYGDGRKGSVIPDNRKIPTDVRIPEGSCAGAVNGHKVVVHITDYGEEELARRKGARRGRFGTSALTGEITEILGHMDDPGVDILSIIRAYNLPQSFPEEVMEEVRQIPQVIPTDRDEGEREDWRDVLTVTIDGPDTKDIDDAISVRRLKDEDAAWELGVHIADVAEYVKENTALDLEARKRATSNYLVDRVIPMLPHELSNGICSLNPGEDRFALSCIMRMDKTGNVTEARIAETVIRSDAKLSYPGVMQLFDEKDESEIKAQLSLQGMKRGIITKSHAIAAMLRRGLRLSGILSKKRMADGAIDFEFPECKIHLDTDGHVTEIVPYERNAATMMIENFMVAANETVAEHFYWLGVPFVFRTHGVPDEEKMQNLRKFVQSYGYRLNWKQGEIHPKELQTLLAGLKGKPEEATISVMTLRSMQRAMYTTTCGGHFGLALRYYCHFTSPIRRYPDLQIHRIIKEYQRGKLTAKRRSHYDSLLPEVCRQSSDMERRADEAERETNKQKMCEYMKGHLSEAFTGSISGVTGWGIYVQLPNTVEGLVPVRSLRDDYYSYVEEKALLVGERTGKSFGLGQKINVVVSSVDTTARTIDFELQTENDGEGSQEGNTDRATKRPHRKKFGSQDAMGDDACSGDLQKKPHGEDDRIRRLTRSGDAAAPKAKKKHGRPSGGDEGRHSGRKRRRRKHHAGEHQTDREQ